MWEALNPLARDPSSDEEREWPRKWNSRGLSVCDTVLFWSPNTWPDLGGTLHLRETDAVLLEDGCRTRHGILLGRD
jgi:hypothetical protein